jgi:hypothetical protein
MICELFLSPRNKRRFIIVNRQQFIKYSTQYYQHKPVHDLKTFFS